MLEKLTTRATALGEQAARRVIDRLAKCPTPPGVAVEPGTDGVVLSGRGLRRRMIDDPRLRNFGR